MLARRGRPPDSPSRGVTKHAELPFLLTLREARKAVASLSPVHSQTGRGVMRSFKSGEEYELRVGRILIRKLEAVALNVSWSIKAGEGLSTLLSCRSRQEETACVPWVLL